MAEYRMNEALFEPPAGWLDGSVTMLKPSDDREDLKILVTRTPIGKESLLEHSNQQTKMLSQRVSWFEIVSESETTVAGQPAYALRATFKDSGHDLYQHRVLFAHGPKFVSIIVAGKASATAEIDAILMRVVTSVELTQSAS